MRELRADHRFPAGRNPDSRIIMVIFVSAAYPSVKPQSNAPSAPPADMSAHNAALAALARPLNIGGLQLRNRVLAAPMSGVSDLPFRQRAWGGGAGLAVAEMAASSLLAQQSGGAAEAETLRRLQTGTQAGGADFAAVQLAGREPRAMAEAARRAEGAGARLIDINMGCPAKKLALKNGGQAACGAALMRDEPLALRIIAAVAAAVSCPVSVKMRLGWDEQNRNAARLAHGAEQAGAAMITVHARTREQFYRGKADWAAARAVRAAISVPLIINGDIADSSSAAQAMAQSGADGVMIGRASYGRPWLAGELAGHKPPADIPAYIIEHYRDMLAHYGIARGLRHARKHLDWYLQRHADGLYSAEERAALMAVEEPAETEAMLAAIFARREGEAAAVRE